jgi:DNA-binding FadR family transcriptional regulator
MEAAQLAVGGRHGPEPEVGRRHSDRIAADLRDDILAGRYKTGQRLPPERDLATRLSVNRGSVREALKKLEQLGLVEIRRGDGAHVRPLSDASVDVVRDLLRLGDGVDRRLLEQLLDVHEMLSTGAAALAVEKLSDATLARVRAIVAELAAPGLGALEFHQRVEALVDIATEATGHLVLRLFRNSFGPAIVDGLRELAPWLGSAGEDVGAAVRRLDAALAARDAAATGDAVRALSLARREWLGRALDAYEASRGGAAPQPGN